LCGSTGKWYQLFRFQYNRGSELGSLINTNRIRKRSLRKIIRKSSVDTGSHFTERAVEVERAEFKHLLMKNPNYFGNLPESPFKMVKKIVGNTKYEELTCVGFNPNLDMLAATVQVKLQYGYKGGLCGSGSTEYVRFYVDYGGGWENAGLAAFNVHDIPDANDCADKPTKPLSYVVTLPIEPKRDYCGDPILPNVRAILSWESVPPDDDPDWPMVWGNVLDRHIQIKPSLWLLAHVVKAIEIELKQKVKLPPMLEELVPCPIPQPEPSPLELPDLMKLYAAPVEEKVKKARLSVEPHRFGFNEIQAQLAPGTINQKTLSKMIAKWASLGLKLPEAVEALQATSGDVSYEELDCLGLDYNREWLVATFGIKKPCGYLSDLCGTGSKEYIAFWADWDDTCEWTYLDTVEVKAYDIASIPADGLHYMAVLPVNLNLHRQPCNKPKIARVRAVLSWNTSPSTTDPDDIPHWGNRMDVHVQIKPGKPEVEPTAQISIIGGIGIADIDTAGSGTTKPMARFAEWGTYADPWGAHTRDCPFGGLITAHGLPISGHGYCIEVREFGSTDPPTLIKNRIWLVDKNGHGYWHYSDPTTGRFDYKDVTLNVLNKLAQWNTDGNGLWEIRLRLYNPAGILIDQTPWYNIRLDNTRPTAEITIDGGACDKYHPGDVITGKFVARDTYFGHFELDTLPLSMSPPKPTTGTPPASSGETQTAISGDAWELKTSSMKPCGYVVRVRVWDRTIRDSAIGHHNRTDDDKGFCILEED
jgi:hypothetical protein